MQLKAKIKVKLDFDENIQSTRRRSLMWQQFTNRKFGVRKLGWRRLGNDSLEVDQFQCRVAPAQQPIRPRPSLAPGICRRMKSLHPLRRFDEGEHLLTNDAYHCNQTSRNLPPMTSYALRSASDQRSGTRKWEPAKAGTCREPVGHFFNHAARRVGSHSAPNRMLHFSTNAFLNWLCILRRIR